MIRYLPASVYWAAQLFPCVGNQSFNNLAFHHPTSRIFVFFICAVTQVNCIANAITEKVMSFGDAAAVCENFCFAVVSSTSVRFKQRVMIRGTQKFP